MSLKIIIASTLALSAFTVPAFADDNDGAITGAAGGAATGAIVGGPVGAVVGGVVGLAAGAALDPPPREVITYVEQQPMPETVVVQEPVEVGRPIPQTVVLTPVPDNPTYSYAVVNQQRVIVDPRTHTVVQVLQ
ncbi:DUF1236 domain-containing protein [Sinorhizobium sp. BG8]|uniref:DUF1236 domain-containing protein n=1 Tax=Sinorhizobium sp. BG8 TaxID=2613773 RepID=UPI00193CD8C4|nr:DUF1236 domain-containing protein [Sinorhizobium sp. BG8]QRM54961.1 DUF1236 domain-containing protein [Sinorhizobium sp. BG8]